MSETGHDLQALFPHNRPILRALKIEDASFRKLAERYHELELEIQRVDAGLDAASDERIEELKKERLRLLDDVAGMIEAREAE